MKTLSASDLAAIPIDQRIRLVEDLWDSIAEFPEAVEIPAWHKTELERRLREYDANPNEGSPWSEVKQRIIG
ncbi:addiction module protein [Candidatus Thiosymbion oneisti]|uniref:addiction module protein n=1 Tax=Candidatus Thiosymbion oneisti TaxID=589554 RepID=UPI000B7D03E5|nr:addiction module protein [Candidatus Thiosymbion oneisti]